MKDERNIVFAPIQCVDETQVKRTLRGEIYTLLSTKELVDSSNNRELGQICLSAFWFCFLAFGLVRLGGGQILWWELLGLVAMACGIWFGANKHAKGTAGAGFREQLIRVNNILCSAPEYQYPIVDYTPWLIEYSEHFLVHVSKTDRSLILEETRLNCDQLNVFIGSVFPEVSFRVGTVPFRVQVSDAGQGSINTISVDVLLTRLGELDNRSYVAQLLSQFWMYTNSGEIQTPIEAVTSFIQCELHKLLTTEERLATGSRSEQLLLAATVLYSLETVINSCRVLGISYTNLTVSTKTRQAEQG